MKKTAALHQQTIAQLQTALAEERVTYAQAKIAQQAGKPVKGNTKQMADQIARLLTIIREKELSS